MFFHSGHPRPVPEETTIWVSWRILLQSVHSQTQTTHLNTYSNYIIHNPLNRTLKMVRRLKYFVVRHQVSTGKLLTTKEVKTEAPTSVKRESQYTSLFVHLELRVLSTHYHRTTDLQVNTYTHPCGGNPPDVLWEHVTHGFVLCEKKKGIPAWLNNFRRFSPFLVNFSHREIPRHSGPFPWYCSRSGV